MVNRPSVGRCNSTWVSEQSCPAKEPIHQPSGGPCSQPQPLGSGVSDGLGKEIHALLPTRVTVLSSSAPIPTCRDTSHAPACTGSKQRVETGKEDYPYASDVFFLLLKAAQRHESSQHACQNDILIMTLSLNFKTGWSVIIISAAATRCFLTISLKESVTFA